LLPGSIHLALKIIGVNLNPAPTSRETDTMFEQIRNEILSIGFDEILSIPRSNDPKIELAIALLNDAGTYSICFIILNPHLFEALMLIEALYLLY